MGEVDSLSCVSGDSWASMPSTYYGADTSATSGSLPPALPAGCHLEAARFPAEQSLAGLATPAMTVRGNRPYLIVNNSTLMGPHGAATFSPFHPESLTILTMRMSQ